MHDQLRQSGYGLDLSGVWTRAVYTPLPYNDGDAVEERIADLLRGVSDRSVLSDELRPLCTDWPTLYHLGHVRANLLRPFEARLRDADVLEVGAGCGAITRYLGETAGQVLALEGSPRRARIARHRTTDLPNVSVVVDRFDGALQWPGGFDVVTLVGVLEYAGRFESGANPWLSMLNRARQLLKPGGVVLVAIENQLGLKYLLGAREDHAGVVGYGIEAQYKPGDARTFGRKVFSTLLTDAGFGAWDVLVPLPDYKCPRTIVSSAGLADATFDVAGLAAQSVTHDPQFRAGGLGAPERVWPTVAANGLMLDLANSFLIVAANEDAIPPADSLAWHYSTSRRRAFCKATRFFRKGETIHVEARRLGVDSPPAGGPLRFVPHEHGRYVPGEPLAATAVRIITSHQWRLEELISFFVEYLGHITTLVGQVERPMSVGQGEVPGEWIDALPQNLVVGSDGRATLIDREWISDTPIPVAFLVFRAVLSLTDLVTRMGQVDDPRVVTRLDLVESVLGGLGLEAGRHTLGRFVELESNLQRQVNGASGEFSIATLAANDLPRKTASDPGGVVPVEVLNAVLRGLAPDSTALRRHLTSRAYGANNPDVVEAGHHPYEHWMEQGFREGRLPTDAVERLTRELTAEHEVQRRIAADNAEALATRTVEVTTLEEALARQHEAAAVLRRRVEDRDRDLAAVYASTSWRVTRGLRGISRLARRVAPPYVPGDGVFRTVRWFYRRIPLPRRVKHHGRAAWMRRLFKYQQAPSVPAPLPAITALAPADGRREWASYAPFKARLVAHAETVRERLSPAAVDVLAISERDAPVAAGRIRFNPPDAPLVTILVPVYGGTALAVECLASLARARVRSSFEVIVADDASPDGTAEVLALVEGIRLRRNPVNVGFLRNCNLAFADARGAFTVILNSDVQVTDGWLDALVDVFDTYSDAGAAGPRILYPSGHLQEAGVALRPDATSDMVGLNDDPSRACYSFVRPVDYCSGAALMVRTGTLRELGGFDDAFAPAYCEDADLCLRLRARGLKSYYTPHATVVHHLSRTMSAISPEWKTRQVATNLATFTRRWAHHIASTSKVRVLAFYLPQFHAIPENDAWWGEGFTEWTNVLKARPNFEGHYQPRVPADLGYYDLADPTAMDRQAALARRYGIDGFVYYYYWFGGKRLLEMPLERLLATGRPDHPYCICWANENWSRRWDGRDQEILIGQAHSENDDRAVIRDIARHFGSALYIRVDGRPLVLVYRVELFPDFRETAARWRDACRADGHGEIYLAYVESHDLVHKGIEPSAFGCDASVEFPPLNMAERTTPSGALLNPQFQGAVGDYAATAFQFCTRELPGYTRFRGVMPGWDNTPRRQDHGFAFERSTPGVFQAWLEHVIAQTRAHRHGDERLVFVNAWNEWAEGAYLEPDQVFGHGYLEAVRNAKDAERLLRLDSYGLTA
jgi:GT2 family glycosyltransferase/SAM-dependent methyltransferase